MPPSGVFLFTALFSARERARNYIRDNLYRRNQKVRGPGRRVDSRDCCSLQHVNLFYRRRRRRRRKTTGKQSDSDSSGIQLRNILPIYSKLSTPGSFFPPSLPPSSPSRSLRARCAPRSFHPRGDTTEWPGATSICPETPAKLPDEGLIARGGIRRGV